MQKRKRLKRSARFQPRRGVRLSRRKESHKVVSKSGLPVRSSYESTAVEYFSENNIAFEYEPLMLLGGRQFRPDFYLPDLDLFLEICGYNHMPHYRDRVAQKKALYGKFGMNSLFIDIKKSENLKEKLAQQLAKAELSPGH